MAEFVHLTDAELAALGITTDEIVAAIEDAIGARRDGRVHVSPKSEVEPGDGRHMMTTLGLAEDPPSMVVKAVVLNPRNVARSRDVINATILVLDGETGELRAVMDANWITAVRTAGLSAVAARRLANPRARTIAFIGAGVQARSHLQAFADLYPLDAVRVFSRGRANIDALGEAAGVRGLRFHVTADARDAMAEADIVVSSITATYKGPPFADARWLRPGAFAAITDLARPWDPAGLAAFGTIAIDDLEQEAAMRRPMVPPELVAGDLGALVGGDLRVSFDPARSSAFVFRGVAIGDVAVANLALARASRA